MSFFNDIGNAFNDVAKETGKFVDDASKAVPGVGHVRALVHKIDGDEKAADECLKASNRASAGLVGGAAGFMAGGPMGAAAGAFAAQGMMDGAHTAIDSINNGKFTSHGYFKNAEKFANDPLDMENNFDAGLDAVLTLSGGYGMGKEIGKKMAQNGMKNSFKNVGKTAFKNHAKQYRLNQYTKNMPKGMLQKRKRDMQRQIARDATHQLKGTHQVAYGSCTASNHYNQPKAASKNCPGRHGLRKFATPNSGYGCDKCKRRFGAGTIMYGCRKCNYDLCASCNGSSSSSSSFGVYSSNGNGYSGGYGGMGGGGVGIC